MDPFNDPRFPDRPNHPDFWRLMDLVNKQDGDATEGDKSIPEIFDGVIDEKSLMYMADQRALRALTVATSGHPTMIVTSTFLDAFLLGYRFKEAGGHRE